MRRSILPPGAVRRELAVVLLLLSLVQAGFAGGFFTLSRGARSIGMGGACIAYPADPSVTFTNPAGVAFLRGMYIQGGTGFSINDAIFRSSGGDGSTDNGVLTLPAAYFSYAPQRTPISFGIGYTEPFSFRTRWDNPGWAGRSQAEEASLTASYMTAAAAGAMTRQLYVGAALHVVSASLRDFDGNTSYGVMSDGRGASASFTASGLFVPIPQLALAVAFQTGSNVPMRGISYAGLGAPLPTDSGASGTFQSKVSFPSVLTFGIAAHPSSNITFEADVQVLGWAAFDAIDRAYPSGGGVVAPIEPHFSNSYNVRAGGEVILSRILPIRAGIVWEPTPVDDKNLSPFFPDNDRLTLTAGVGVRFSKNIEFDVAYAAGLQSDRNGSVAGLAGSYSFSNTLVAASLAWSFEALSNPLKPPESR
jgi:long-chain fatty acid transport protein